ncbi:FAD-dependent oxidoreductase [Candidatus Woesearchaeota archaeon]|nr:FAD-dependent oxidoreductase [Candidatus Woesearchaeota archaeon]
MNKKKLIILGGGLSGLAAGEILSKHFEVEIFESAPFLGGLASNFEKEGKFIPRYYHHIIQSNTITQEYLKRFGDIENLNWKKIKVAIGVDGKTYNVNEIKGLLKFNYLTLWEKIRFGLFGLYSLYFINLKNIEDDLDAEKWLRRYAGVNVTTKIFHHLYSRNKFNFPLSKISAKQFANRLHEKEIFDYFSFPQGGYQKMIDNLKNAIEKNWGSVKINSNISKIDIDEKYIINNGTKKTYDFLISSIPLEVFSGLTEGIPPELKNNIAKIKYCPAVCVCFATEDFLDQKNYWINLFNERIHLIMQHSLLNDEYGDKINWCLRYGGSEEDLELSDEKIKEAYLDVVKKYFPLSKIKWVRVFRTKYAEPIYDIDYHKYMPDYKVPIKGLYFVGIQLTYPKIRNMNSALESGIHVANLILKEFRIS